MNDKKAKVAAQTVALAIGIILTVLLSGCNEAGTYAESDSGYTYKSYKQASIPVDDTLYTLTGVVVGDVNSITRPGPAKVVTTYRSDYYSVGTYFPPEMNGKGLVRLWVEKSDFLGVPAETIAIIKSTDTKLIAVLPGDRITLRCRVLAEAIAPSYTGQVYDPNKAVTLELDFCRMLSPVIDVKQAAPAKAWTEGMSP